MIAVTLLGGRLLRHCVDIAPGVADWGSGSPFEERDRVWSNYKGVSGKAGRGVKGDKDRII